MAGSEFDAKALIKKYKEGICSDEEKLLVEHWYENINDSGFDLDEQLAEHDLASVWTRLQTDITDKPLQKTKHTISYILRIAAVILLCAFLCGGAYYFISYNKPLKENNEIADKPMDDVAPGGNKATLKLANGSIIVLDKAGNGVLAEESGLKITKTEDGKVVYSQSNGNASGNNEVGKNVIATPRSGQYQVTLPDGTRALLNAESSITYPVLFAGNERRVDISGEVYFEVAKDKKRPFRVFVDNMKVEVLGTHFNVSAYKEDKDISTTLFEGSLDVIKGADRTRLVPGRLARWNKKKENLENLPADLEEAMAWKNGDFVFNKENIQLIMVKLSRWYDVTVVYKGNMSGLNFSAKISRKSTISEVLELFQLTESMKYNIKGREVTISN
ncbi:FecR family protein [Pedobacter panaciterrae]|jgi:Fe2+-dicitrate sensor, membrane component|uniref:FecR domain-containing protein n=1 Tax=Pedobacter panaciterrae TaxID=363849 RepID=A0ABU8NU86_9SPHI|nr:FecR family protein [uncultured Pedobacter sp.]